MFEHRTKPLLSPTRFALRISRHFAAALAVVLGSLWIGVLGYHEFEGMNTTDAFLNAAMILSGMGPVQPLQTEAGKLFAGCYALYSGMVFIAVAGTLVVPFLHRLLHHFHLDHPRDESPD
ncbi:MAG: hypothetical protein ACREVK_13905 [Gammaproteobacteria bacterium]